jgi:hypothetical protein
MEDKTKAQDLYRQFAGKTLDTVTLWTEANQRVLRDLVEFGSGTAKEGVLLYGELSRMALEAMRESQGALFRWPTNWTESCAGAQQAFRHFEKSAEALIRSAERVQANAEQVGKAVQETFNTTVTKLKEQYATK